MPSDPPSPTHTPHPSPHRVQTTPAASTPLPALSPAQAIAQAWHRESAEAQQRWRMADKRAKEQYVNPTRWDTAFRSEKKKYGAKM